MQYKVYGNKNADSAKMIVPKRHHCPYHFVSFVHTASLTFRTVCNELEDVKHKAYEIGVQLGISHGKLMQFKQDGNVLPAAVDHWLSGNVPDTPITWRSVVAVLESKQVGEMGLARVISEKYCCKKEDSKDDKGQYMHGHKQTPFIAG